MTTVSSRTGGFSAGILVGTLLASLPEFLTHYERLGDIEVLKTIAALLIVATGLGFIVPRLGLSVRASLGASAAATCASFVEVGSAWAVPYHAITGAIAVAMLMPAIRTLAGARSLRWAFGGICLGALIHPSLALALGGSAGWWMSAIVASVLALVGWFAATGKVRQVPSAASCSPDQALVIAALALLLTLSKSYFEYVCVTATAAPLAMLCALIGFAIGYSVAGYRVRSLLIWIAPACVLMAVGPLLALEDPTNLATLSIFITGLGAGALLSRPASRTWPIDPVAAAAAGCGLGAAIAVALLSGDSIGRTGQLTLAVASGGVPAAMLLWAAWRERATRGFSHLG